jgi:hypothetical protein
MLITAPFIRSKQGAGTSLVAKVFCQSKGSAYQKAAAMSPRTGASHEISFGQRLANESQRARELAITLPPGKMRDALLEKARLADLAARINGWVASPAHFTAVVRKPPRSST